MTQNAGMTIDEQIAWLNKVLSDLATVDESITLSKQDLLPVYSELIMTLNVVKKNLTSLDTRCVMVSMPMEIYKGYLAMQELILENEVKKQFNHQNHSL